MLRPTCCCCRDLLEDWNHRELHVCCSSSGYIALLKESSSPPGLKFCGSGSVSSWDFETQRDTEVNKSNIFHISALTHCSQSSLQSGKHEDKYPVRSESHKLANERYLKCYHKHKTTTWAAQYLLSSSRLIIRQYTFFFFFETRRTRQMFLRVKDLMCRQSNPQRPQESRPRTLS